MEIGTSSKGSESSSPGSRYFSIDLRRKGDRGGAKRGDFSGAEEGRELLVEGKGVDDVTGEYSSCPGIVSSKSNNSSDTIKLAVCQSRNQIRNKGGYRQQRW